MSNSKAVLLASVTVFFGLVANANVVYDAGAALKENIRSGVKANPYTDVNGGKWEYRWRSNITDNGNLSGTYREHDVFPGMGGESSPWIRVNASLSAQGAGLDKSDTSVNIYDVVPGLAPTVEQMIEPGEILVHPRAYVDTSNGRLYAAIRFKAPEDGWYEADVTVRDLMRQIALCSTNADGSVKTMQIGKFSGAQVTLLANGVQKFQQIVSLEDYATNTWYTENGCVKSFTYHMPTTRLAKDQNIDLVVGNKDDSSESIDVKKIQNYSDSTGVKMTVTKLDRVVYDAGKALRQNCLSGAYTGGTNNTVYIDELGGQWNYKRANDSLNTFYNFAGHTTYTYNDHTFDGFSYDGKMARSIRVNLSGSAVSTEGEPIEPDEMLIHPNTTGSGNYPYCVLQFIVPESGYYSAFMTAHDVQASGTINSNSGAEAMLMVNTNMLASGVVSIENLTTAVKTNATLFTKRFDFQMPVRYMEAGETIEFVVGPNGGTTAGDATGLKAYVTREKEGTFYDAGLAMKKNVAAGWSRKNPYGTVAEGTWYYLNSTVPWVSGIPFGINNEIWASWSPTGLVRSSSLLVRANRTTFGVGFASTDGGTSPFLYGNTNTVNRSGVAPGEIYIHPNISKSKTSPNDRTLWTNKCATLRFRPPESGWYSGSIVVRDVAKSESNGSGGMYGQDGVRVYLNVGNVAVTNAQVELEAFTNSTAHFTIESQLLAAGEPIDIVVYPNDNSDSDGTAISAIFRREQSTYDAGLSFFRNVAPGEAGTNHFADVLGGITWDVGYCTYATNPASFTSMPYQFSKSGASSFYWRGYARAADGSLPRFMIATNGVAGTNNTYVTDSNGMFGTIPCEMWAHPNSGNISYRSAAVRAKVPIDGIYSVRGYARDLASDTTYGDGVRVSVGVGGSVPVTAKVAREARANIPFFESSFAADRLWLRNNETVDFVVEPISGNAADGTGLSSCIVNEGVTPSRDLRVVNVDFTDSDDISPFNKPGREGWSEWRTWNALNVDGWPNAVSRHTFTEASGTTLCNMKVEISPKKVSSTTYVIIGYGESGNLGNYMQNRYIRSSGTGTENTYTFIISNLKPNEHYTLYLYSADGGKPAYSLFKIGDVEKAPDCSWFEGYAFNDVARFDVTSSSEGVIYGEFRKSDTNTDHRGAFNGFTIVGPQDVFPGSLFLLFK